MNDDPFGIIGINDETMDNDEFMGWLELIAEFGIYVLDVDDDEIFPNLKPEQQLILDALIVVGKIGGNTLKEGIERLEADYPENINAVNSSGWGKKPANCPAILMGEKRAIVGLVQKERPNHHNYKETCQALGIQLRKYEDYRTEVNNLDKNKTANHGDNIHHNINELDMQLDYIKYRSQLENKYPDGMPPSKAQLYAFIQDEMYAHIHNVRKRIHPKK